MDGVDLTALLAPIAGEHPAGTDPRDDFSPNSIYFRLRDARSEARIAERQADAADADERPVPPQWAPVRRLALTLLQEQAKDLEVASWLSEALLRTDGLDGLATGFELMTGLVETWWQDLHPRPDDEGMVRRIVTVAGLNGEGADGTLIQPLRKTPLFTLTDGQLVALWQYEQSAETAAISDAARREQRLDAGVTSFSDLEYAARANMAGLRQVRQSARMCIAAWQALETALDALVGAPPMTRVRGLLEDIVAIADRYAGLETEQSTPEPITLHAAPAGQASAAMGGRITSREDAFRVLEEAADFFSRTEPHSPLASTLREAVRRGRLTWSELLAEIVPDLDSRAAILSSLGIRPPPSGE
jgi:type VI secretion system protein ImpA